MKLLITALCALVFALAPALNVNDSLNRKSDEATFTHQTETTENNYKADNLLQQSVLKEENVSVLSDDGADKGKNNDFIKWVDFKVPYEVLKKITSFTYPHWQKVLLNLILLTLLHI